MVEETVKHDIHALKSEAEEVLHTSSSSEENAGVRTEGDEDEEGWTSDKSADGEGPAYASAGDHRKRLKALKTKSTTHPAATKSTRTHRRKHSMGDSGTFSSHARQLLEQQPSTIKPPIENAPVEDEDQRGRSHAPHRQSSVHTTRRSIQHRRLESLKNSEQNSRDVSPARSVRFVDEEPRNGTGTPRTLSDQTGQGSSIVEPSSTDDSDSRSKVTFDLSPSRRGSVD
jgi:hypothetical protein